MKRTTEELSEDENLPGPSTAPVQKKARTRRTKKTEISTEGWPQYFIALFQACSQANATIYKALNTVLAFVTSRKQLALTFPNIRESVEKIIKKPLDLAKVSELKALLPDIVKFAYTPRTQLEVHNQGPAQHDEHPDFGGFGAARDTRKGITEIEEEHVLVLEFADNDTSKNNAWAGNTLIPPTRTPVATKKLIEKRNERFCEAVTALLATNEDSVALIQTAGRNHLPVDPNHHVLDEVGDDIARFPVPTSQDRPSIEAVINEIIAEDWYRDQIVDRRTFEARQASTGELDPPLSSQVTEALKSSRNITTLYTHQVSAIQALHEGKDVIVSTSTASGKSVIYQVPLLRLLEDDPSTKAIFVYPTKALAQDQRTALENLIGACPAISHIKISTYDGDTPMDARKNVRETASVIFTNFDMLHASILPHEEMWRMFLKSVKLFVVDELHYYSGAMGSHVAQIMRRFRRICAAVGNRRTRFVSCSATITNPLEHMHNIFGLDEDSISVVTQDGAPTGSKDFVVWRTGRDDLDSQSSVKDAAALMKFLMKRGIRVIMFCKFRKVCELAMKSLRLSLSTEGRDDVLNRVRAYRGGYSPEDRRAIEHDAFSGQLLGLIATNALELGVDIGALDAVIMVGFPFNLASFRQQAGRAGRRSRDSLSLLVAGSDPMDQHYAINPDELFDKSMDNLVVDLESPVILEAHLQCAANEMPISVKQDEKYFGVAMGKICQERLVRDKDGWYHTHPKFLPYPSRHVSIRGSNEEKFVLVEVKHGNATGARILEEIELTRVLFEVYEGAVYMHQGQTFIVKEVSHDQKLAKLIRQDVNWTTKPRDYTDVNAAQTYRIREIKDSPVHTFYGRIEVLTIVFGFFKLRDFKIIEAVDLETDPFANDTTGMWIDVPNLVLDLLRQKAVKPAAAIHSAEHAIMKKFILSQDMRTECKAVEKEIMKGSESQRKRPARLIFYDAIGSGSMVSSKAFDNVNSLLIKALDAVENCECTEFVGCNNCVTSGACKENNRVHSKLGALIVLKGVLGIDMDPDLLPMEDPESPGYIHGKGQDTIVRASNVLARGVIQVEKS